MTSPAHIVFVVAVLAGIAGGGCRSRDEPIVGAFEEHFDRAALGDAWRSTGGDGRLVDGELVVRGARGRPLWLRRTLPLDDVMIELDVQVNSEKDDIALILYGDGRSSDPPGAPPSGPPCPAVGYLLLFAGATQPTSLLCRADGAGRETPAGRHDWRVVTGIRYQYAITFKDGVIEWRIGGDQMLSWKDPRPLRGPGFDHLGIDGGGSGVTVDNIIVRHPAPR